jgi:hypothetical protein
MNFNNKVNTVDFIVTVPSEVTVDVDNSIGEVSVADTKGNVDIKNDFGDVTIENIEGALSVQTSSGAVNATSIVAGGENIDLRSDFGSVTLKKAGGDYLIRTVASLHCAKSARRGSTPRLNLDTSLRTSLTPVLKRTAKSIPGKNKSRSGTKVQMTSARSN